MIEKHGRLESYIGLKFEIERLFRDMNNEMVDTL